MSETIKVIGGNPLVGEVTPVPNKNAILPALCACILIDDPVYYYNVPKTTDVLKMFEMLRLLGVSVDDSNFKEIKICSKGIRSYTVDKELGNLIRASVMFAGPLLARFGKAKIPVPGGCVLGKRSISAHIDSFQKVGISVSFEDGYVYFKSPKNPLKQYDIWQFEASVTGSENIALYAAGINSSISITDFACEPHAYQLLNLLKTMGAKVDGIGSNKVTIKGSNKLRGAKFTPSADHVDVGGLIVAAAITKGRMRLKNANGGGLMRGMVEWFRKFNINIKEDGKDLVVNGRNELFIDTVNSGFPLAGENLPKFVPRPWPGFPVDVLPVVVTLACKTKGRLLVQNWMYETGLDFIRELNAMGANIFMADPQRIIVNGPVNFKGGRVTAPGIIQACKAVFIASLVDPVETSITGVEILKRRYPDVIEVYKKLGASIEKI